VVEKCLLLDDPRLPKLKIAGQLPYIHLDVVDTRYHFTHFFNHLK
jgi:hypothetical protein